MTILLTMAAALALQSAAAPPAPLPRGRPVEFEMSGGGVREFSLALRAGESADIVAEQQGIDVAVDLLGPDGALLDTIDSPNGRQGPEPVSVFAPRGGAYRIRLRPLGANDPRGRIAVRIAAFRGAAATRRLLAGRQAARSAAARWLARQDSPLPADGRIAPEAPLPAFDSLAAEAAVIGLGEASHGSRELNDVRLSLVERLVERHGFRLIALEDSASRWRTLEAYVAGRTATPAASLEWGWIGRRLRRALLDWVRQWNLAHPGDRVRIVGVDAQDNAADRARLEAFLGRAYGETATAAWPAPGAELAAADARSAVFADSSTSAPLRRFLQEIVAQLATDAPLLRARLGEADYRVAMESAVNLAAFADFNSNEGAIRHSRDWHMAAAILRAVDETPGHPKAIYWAHNAHVSAAATRWGPTGALLRQLLGCRYRAVAGTFGAGGLVAQVPSDPAAPLAVTELAAAGPGDDTLEMMLADVRPGAHLSAWTCGAGAANGDAPAWLNVERRLRWIGGIYAPGSPPSASYQPYRLLAAFDAIAYFPTVSAEPFPDGRPFVPAPTP